MKDKIITPNTERNIRRFWKWFTLNEAAIREALKNGDFMDTACQSFIVKLHTITTRIGYEIAYPKNIDQALIIFTARGNTKLLPKINAIIAGFPGIPNWQVQALVQPESDLEPYKAGTDAPCEFADFELYISQMLFEPFDYDTVRRQLAITVFLPNYRYHYDNPSLAAAVETIIENLVGEVAFYRIITEVLLAQTPDDPAGLLPLYELPEVIQQLRFINRNTNRSINNLLG